MSIAYADFNDGWDAYNKGDYKSAVNEWRSSADQGDAMAQNNLAGMYAMGTGVLKNMTQAKYWTQKAYEGDDKAATALAEKNWEIFNLWKY
jgi:TPR repeat protein